LRPLLVEAGLVTEAEMERYMPTVAQPSARYLPPFMVTAWGRRPSA
jgi:hypothetical protein